MQARHRAPRRRWLAVAAGFALAPWSFAQQRERFPIELAQGVMAGEVTTATAILQSRLTSTAPYVDRQWEGIPGVSGVGRFELSADADFEQPTKTKWLEALPGRDFIVKTQVTGLKPGTRYYYRLIYGPDRENLRTSKPGRFRTHAGPDAAGSVSFAVVTGMNYSFFHHTGNSRVPPYDGPDKHLGYPALEAIHELKPDFFVGTGDNVYYDHPGMAARAQTQHQMRVKHHQQYSQPRFLRLFRDVAAYWMKDDHDYRFNDADPINPVLIKTSSGADYYPKTNELPRYSGSGFRPSHELGVRMFREQLPVVAPNDSGAVTYRTYRVNRLLQIWFVEGRDYRSPNDMPDGPDKSIWGTHQKAWLKRTLFESDATLKLLFSPTPMVGPDSRTKRDNHVNPRGFRHEGDQFFLWLEENGFSPGRFFIVCGDRHWQYHAVHPSGFQEFSAGALVDENAILGIFPGESDSSDPKGEIKQPYHYEEPTGGFLLVEIAPARGKNTATVAFRFYDETGDLLYSYP